MTGEPLLGYGRSMPRERRQNGWVEKTGKRTKMWTGHWYVYVMVDGIEKRRPRSKVLGKCADMTKGAAIDALREEIRGARPPQSNATFAQLATWYLKTNDGRWSKKWKGTVHAMFEHQILPEIGPRLAVELKKSEIQQAINAIAAKPNSQSESMVQKCLNHIRACFNLAIDDELLERNPALKVDMPPTKKPCERFLELSECKRLLEVATRRDSIILRLFMVLGFRPGELFALRVNDLQPGKLRIDQTVVDYQLSDGAKTEESVGDVPLPPELEAELRAYIRDEGITDLLFPSTTGTVMSPDNYLDRTLKQLGVLAGIDVFTRADGTLDSRLNHQALRRTTGTHFQKHGQIKDTQALLRHTDAATTLKHYQKKLDESLVSGVDKWDAELVPRKAPGVAEERVSLEDEKRRVN